jgi:hypothetical protein
MAAISFINGILHVPTIYRVMRIQNLKFIKESGRMNE